MIPAGARCRRFALAAALATSATGYGEGTRQAAAYLAVPLSIRQMGMGEVSAGGHDVLRAWSNPALLSMPAETYEFSAQGSRLTEGQAAFGGGVAWRPSPRTGFGFLLARHEVRFRELDAAGMARNEEVGSDQLAPALVAAGTLGRLHAGIAAKFVSEQTMPGARTAAPAADIGLARSFGRLTAGAALLNIGPALYEQEKFSITSSGGSGSEGYDYGIGSMPTEFRGSLAYRFEAWRVTAGAEMATGTAGTRIGLGAEWWLAPMFALRAGAADLAGSLQVTAGLSVLYQGLGIDYAFRTHADLGAGHRVALTYAYSAGADESTEESTPSPVRVARKPGEKLLNFAISDLRAENVSAGDAAVMGDLLRSELVKTGAFNVVEKQNMEKVLAEHAFQQTGCTSEECAVKLGKLLNVQVMGVGSFGKLLDAYFLNIRVVNIETGQVAVADSAEGKTVSDLKIAVREMARRLAVNVR